MPSGSTTRSRKVGEWFRRDALDEHASQRRVQRVNALRCESTGHDSPHLLSVAATRASAVTGLTTPLVFKTVVFKTVVYTTVVYTTVVYTTVVYTTVVLYDGV
jgi:hypothetical protein